MKAYELLGDESKWCQKSFAVDVHGLGICAGDPQAVAWCLDGALLRCYYVEAHTRDQSPADTRYSSVYCQVADALQAGEPGIWGGVSVWNDDPTRTYADVVGLLKRLDI
mgnify:CR=1 FL=1